MTEIEMGGEFAFTIAAWREHMRMADGTWSDDVAWSVTLPHQCGPWGITGNDNASTKAEAITRLERFIAEAQATLGRLRALPEDAHDAPDDAP